MPFSLQRLGIARKLRMLNKGAFCKAIGITDRTLLRWEQMVSVPTERYIELCAEKLQFPKEFFFGDSLEEPNLEGTSFRSQSSMVAATRDAVIASGALGFLVSDWVESRFNLPETNVPSLHFAPDPEAASRMLREEWLLGEMPISNMVQLLESKGVRVFSLVEQTATINAYAYWHNSKPFVFLNSYKSAECSRFDAAHELAHLVLHRDGKSRGRQAEDQAHGFASAFLMPKADVLGVFRKRSVNSIQELIEKKARWKVSVGALAHRLHRIGVISDWKYRDFCIEIGRRGFRTNEPRGIERERSAVWNKIVKLLWSEGRTHVDIAKDLSIPISEVEELLFGVFIAPTKLVQPDSPRPFDGSESPRAIG